MEDDDDFEGDWAGLRGTDPGPKVKPLTREELIDLENDCRASKGLPPLPKYVYMVCGSFFKELAIYRVLVEKETPEVTVENHRKKESWIGWIHSVAWSYSGLSPNKLERVGKKVRAPKAWSFPDVEDAIDLVHAKVEEYAKNNEYELLLQTQRDAAEARNRRDLEAWNQELTSFTLTTSDLS